MSTLHLSVAGRTVEVDLADSAPTRDLLAQLPLTLSFRDFGGQEKLATLPEPLSMEGVPARSGAQAGDLGYYAPDNVLVLYYTDVGSYPGIVRLGRITEADMSLIREQPDGFEVSIAPG